MSTVHRRSAGVNDQRVIENDGKLFRRVTASANIQTGSTLKSNLVVTATNCSSAVLKFIVGSGIPCNELSISELVSQAHCYVQEPETLETCLRFSFVDTTPSILASRLPQSLKNGGAWLASFIPEGVTSSVSTVRSYATWTGQYPPSVVGKAAPGQYYVVSSEVDKGMVTFSVDLASNRV